MDYSNDIDMMTLSWTVPEIRESLQQVAQALGEHLANPHSQDAIKRARLHLHQTHGALQVADLPGVTLLTNEAEQILAGFEDGSLQPDEQNIATLNLVLRAVTEYLEDLQSSGKMVPVLVLYPYYRDLLGVRKAIQPDPTMLFEVDLDRSLPASVREQISSAPDAQERALNAARVFERALPALIRGENVAAAVEALREAMHRLLRYQPHAGARVFYWLSYALMDAIKHGALKVDLATRRAVGRINIQNRHIFTGQGEVPAQFIKELLLLLAQARPGSAVADEAKKHFRLDTLVPADYERPRYGLADPETLRVAREALAQVHRTWEKIAGGTVAEEPAFAEAVGALNKALARTPYAGLGMLGKTLATMPVALADLEGKVREMLAIEVATAVLFMEEALAGALRSNPSYDDRAQELAARISSLLADSASFDPTPLPWLVELSSQATDRMTQTAFVGELKHNLVTCEQALDDYFRDETAIARLETVEPLLVETAAVLTMLEFRDAATACRTIIAQVDDLLNARVALDEHSRRRLADGVSSVGFFVETLLQSDGRSRRFRYDAARGMLFEDTSIALPVAGGGAGAAATPAADMPAVETPAPMEQGAAVPVSAVSPVETAAMSAAELPASRAAAGISAENGIAPAAAVAGVADIASASAAASVADVASTAGVAPASDVASAADIASAADTASDAEMADAAAASALPEGVLEDGTVELSPDDAELHEIFLMEAAEVLDAIKENLGVVRRAPDDREAMTTIRRGFHTLKGSGRMVGLDAFGEAAWAFEQMMNHWLSEDKDGTPALFDLIGDGATFFSSWVEQMQAAPRRVLDAGLLIARCQAFPDKPATVAKPQSKPAAAPAAQAATVPASTASVVAEPAAAVSAIAEPVAAATPAMSEQPAAPALFAPSDMGATAAAPAAHPDAMPALPGVAAAAAAATGAAAMGAAAAVAAMMPGSVAAGAAASAAFSATENATEPAEAGMADDLAFDMPADPALSAGFGTLSAGEQDMPGLSLDDALNLTQDDGLPTLSLDGDVVAAGDMGTLDALDSDDLPMLDLGDTASITSDAAEAVPEVEALSLHGTELSLDGFGGLDGFGQDGLHAQDVQEPSPFDAQGEDDFGSISLDSDVPAEVAEPVVAKDDGFSSSHNFARVSHTEGEGDVRQQLEGFLAETSSWEAEMQPTDLATLHSDPEPPARSEEGLAAQAASSHFGDDALDAELASLQASPFDGDFSFGDEEPMLEVPSFGEDLSPEEEAKLLAGWPDAGVEEKSAADDFFFGDAPEGDDFSFGDVDDIPTLSLTGEEASVAAEPVAAAASLAQAEPSAAEAQPAAETQHAADVQPAAEADTAFAPTQPLNAAAPEQAVAPAAQQPAEQARTEQAPLTQAPAAQAGKPAAPAPEVHESLVRIGERLIDAELFDIFNAEATQSRMRMNEDWANWHASDAVRAPESLVRTLHTLVGTSRHVGLVQVRGIAASLEKLLIKQRESNTVLPDNMKASMQAAIGVIDQMLAEFASRTEPLPDPDTAARMESLLANWDEEIAAAAQPEKPAATENKPREMRGEDLLKRAAEVLGAARRETQEKRDPLAGLVDEIDPDLGPVFFEEAEELMPQVDNNLREWRERPADGSMPAALMRLFHTIKGSARMAGAMRFGQMIHELETQVEEALAQPPVQPATIEAVLAGYDQAVSAYEVMLHPELAEQRASEAGELAQQCSLSAQQHADAQVVADEAGAADAAAPAGAAQSQGEGAPVCAQAAAAAARAAAAKAAVAAVTARAAAEKSEQAAENAGATALPESVMAGAAANPAAAAQHVIRVRADLLDRMVAEAGEVAIARARLDSEMGLIRSAINELTENVNRLRLQLREIEIQADNQIQAKIAHSNETETEFDPLEFDRYTRFQEVTRMLAESVNDVSTVQQNALRALDAAMQDLARQGQVSRSLQQSLMRVRMVAFSTINDRLYRVVRQAGKDTGKRVTLEIKGGQAEIDRNVLDRMAGPIEHILRNSVAHGVEDAARRATVGKPEVGELTIEVSQDGNEVIMRFLDDGAGLDYPRIEARARERGLIAPEHQPSERELAQMIFAPGFSTAKQVTALAGRGVGMDVVRAEVAGLGGRIDVDSTPGKGSCFTVHLPVSLAVTQVVLLEIEGSKFAVQSALVEQIVQMKPEALTEAYQAQKVEIAGERMPFYFLGSLLEIPGVKPAAQRVAPVVVLRAGATRIALHVDSVVPNQEVVIKHIGPQLARLAGVAGATVLGNGDIVLILNPVQLAMARVAGQLGKVKTATFSASELQTAATVMVVDDSVTVRKVTQRLLVREGYNVLLARDGVDALRQMQEVIPDVMLVDIEMPRMDGFDLTKNVREHADYSNVPIIMITSRTAEKHRNHALSLGVDVFLGKPFSEDDLLRHVKSFASQRAPRAMVS